MPRRVIIPVSPIGILEAYGYTWSRGERYRRAALRQMFHHEKYVDIIRRMNATAIRFKRTHPEITKVYRNDMEYLRRYRERMD